MMPSAFGFAAYLTQDVGLNEEVVLRDLNKYLLKEGLSQEEIHAVSTGRANQCPPHIYPLYLANSAKKIN